MEYLYKAEIWIEADSIEEAEEIYSSCDWTIDYHSVYVFDENGNEVEVDLP